LKKSEINKINRVQLGRNRSRPRRTVRVAHARGVGSVHAHSACAARGHVGARPTATRAWPALAGPASAATLPGEPVAARHRRTRDGGSDGSPARRRRRNGDGEAAGYDPGDASSDRGSRGTSSRDDDGAREAAVGWRGRGSRDVARGARRRSACGAGLRGTECGRCQDAALS
jgi:hypothetical protein